MIPSHWRPYHRGRDRELVGYVVPDDGGALVVPVSLIGLPLGPAQPVAAAADRLDEFGLQALDHRWWCRLPTPLPRAIIDARTPEADWCWRAVVLVEVGPDGCRVRPALPAPEEFTAQAGLPTPVGDLLRHQPPD